MTTILIPIPRTEEATSFVDRVARYLPDNYEVTGILPVDPGAYGEGPSVIVTGEDYAGWTAEDYVLPRLASGLIIGRVSDVNYLPQGVES